MSQGPAPPSFVVIICTRNRPSQVLEALDALKRQELSSFPVVVVDQSEQIAPELRDVVAKDSSLTLIHDDGRGLSRARNVACRATVEEWLVFVDDDCLPEPDFTAQFVRTVDEHPEADLISGHVGGRSPTPQPDDLPFSVFPVEEELTLTGRWVHPSRVGFGVCFAVRRSMVERLGGWDERLGPGAPDFPAADDMDFNFRMLRAGGVAHRTPAMRSQHDQWRSRDEIVDLYAGYMAAWMGLSVKTFLTADRLAGIWLWWGAGPRFLYWMLASGVRRRSSFRVRVAVRSAGALFTGMGRALQRSW
ncbi:MAG: glycosyltransferase family 2 protein [Actinomycetota bacterium]|nr:glycosyltransferase family 2 protein [Actinomycetota bacterium]